MSAEERRFLLHEVGRFCQIASEIQGVKRISLVGSLTMAKNNPKDADLVVIIREDIDLEKLAIAGRKIKGKAQSRNLGADIFLADENGKYLGRTCSWRECHVRAACRGNQCYLGTFLCDDLQVVSLDQGLILQPPLDLWPTINRRESLPIDVETILANVSSPPNKALQSD